MCLISEHIRRVCACRSGPLRLERPHMRKSATVAAPGGGDATLSLVAEPTWGTVLMAEDRSLKRFSGETEDPGKDLKKWKAWAQPL